MIAGKSKGRKKRKGKTSDSVNHCGEDNHLQGHKIRSILGITFNPIQSGLPAMPSPVGV